MESEVRQVKLPIKAPIAPDGSLLHYPISYDDHAMKEVPPFCARLTLTGSLRGRSAAYFMWKDETGASFPMFLSDMTDLLNNGSVVKGVAAEQWQICKRGANYGIRRVKDQ
jgi:hypothetical protein